LKINSAAAIGGSANATDTHLPASIGSEEESTSLDLEPMVVAGCYGDRILNGEQR
jgi:hypothetical protein